VSILSSDASTPLPSERSFGFLFAAIFVLLAGYGWLIVRWAPSTLWGLVGAAACFGFSAVLAPRLLAPLNRAWFQLGQLLGKVVSPIVLGAIFFLLLTPVSLVTRAFGRDELRLKRKSHQESYWIDRVPSGPKPESFKNQF
jgi:hypothetical protein